MGGGAESDFVMIGTQAGSHEQSAVAVTPEIESSPLDDEIAAFQTFLERLEKAVGGKVATGSGSSTANDTALEIVDDSIPDEENSLVFSRDNVALHPSSEKVREIPGSLHLAKRDSSVFMTWQPYYLETTSTEIEEFVQQQSVILREVPLASFQSVRRFSPSLAIHYVIIVLKSGLALPPLYFHSGGIKDLLSAIRAYALVTRHRDRKDVYFINYVQDPFQASLSELGLPALKPKRSFRKRNPSKSGSFLEDSYTEGLLSGKPEEPGRGFLPNPAELALSVLERMSVVTRVTRGAASRISEMFEQGAQGQGSFQGHKYGFEKSVFKDNTGERGPPGRAVRREENGTWRKGKKETAQLGEKRSPLTASEFKTFLDQNGRISSPDALKQRIFRGGLDPDIRHEAWMFLLGCFPYSSTEEERFWLRNERKKEYLKLRDAWMSVTEEEAKNRPGFKDQLNAVDKDVTRTDPTEPFLEGPDNENVQTLRAVLTTYSFYDPAIGYCQGMCDILTPLVFVLRSEADAFWCFVALMRKVGGNFHPNQTAMQLQLNCLHKLVELVDAELHAHFLNEDCLNFFFCFRWIFLLFKREFSFAKSVEVFDVLFTRQPSRFFHLFMCVAVLKSQKAAILEQQMDFDTLLKHVNSLSGRIDLQETLARAEQLHKITVEVLGGKLD